MRFAAFKNGGVVGGAIPTPIFADRIDVASNGTLSFFKDGREIDAIRPGGWEVACVVDDDGRTPSVILGRGAAPKTWGMGVVEIEGRGLIVQPDDWRARGPELLYAMCERAGRLSGGAWSVGVVDEDGSYSPTAVFSALAWRFAAISEENGRKRTFENPLYVAHRSAPPIAVPGRTNGPPEQQ